MKTLKAPRTEAKQGQPAKPDRDPTDMTEPVLEMGMGEGNDARNVAR